jgi:hypothetical protein
VETVDEDGAATNAFVSLSEINGQKFSSVAELDVQGGPL